MDPHPFSEREPKLRESESRGRAAVVSCAGRGRCGRGGAELSDGRTPPPQRRSCHSRVSFPSCKTWITLSINSSLEVLVLCLCPTHRINSDCRPAATWT